MSKSRFPLYMSEDEHRAVRIAAAHRGATMTDYIRAAIVEKLTREENPPRSEYAARAAPPAATPPTLPNDVLAKANAEKPPNRTG